MYCLVFRQKFTDVSEEHTASIFMAEEQAKQVRKAFFLLADLLRIVGELLPNYWALRPKRQSSSQIEGSDFA
jgi:hypothetical protein